ncbi:hypothetical protein MTR_7g111480 [Medicago truncatula]|uniref:Uncharacterized protein n=1 Tax=Medicago truncatula TaxID=3880 RepID=Q2HRR3_MEDTR|nr:hypothetical protein MtrDRAFT_AC157894g32v2 [Medicago truncatula]AES82355.1 hypothetical protein MTR_7g111480 [Medicago truncatula]
MAGKNRLKKSFFFVFSMFKSKKSKVGIKRCDHGFESGSKMWHISDYDDKERWGAADPQINKKAGEFIHRQKMKLVSDLN